MSVTKISRRTYLATAGCLLWMTTGCQKPPEPAKIPPPDVTIATPVTRDVVDYADFTGTVQAVESVEIRARVPGYLESTHFKEGDIVEKGAPLFRLERAPFVATLDAAKAKEQQVVAQVQLAESRAKRAESIVGQGAISREEYEIRLAEVAVAKAELLSAKAQVEQAEIDLNYTAIRSPITGRIGRSRVDPGNLVGAGENTLLTTIESVDPVHVFFDVPEQAVINLLRLEQEWKKSGTSRDKEPRFHAYVGLADEDDFPHKGLLDFIDNKVDRDTGTAIVRGVFPNSSGLLYPGLFVKVRVPRQMQKGALLVEEKAIGTDLAGKYLLVVGDNDIVEQNPVTLGTDLAPLRVINKGLTATDRYIVDGLQRARPGLPVRPQAADSAQKRPADGEPTPAEPK